jgi:signal transduction histidine kinase
VAGNYGALDMRLMERVLDNLVNNALRYSNQRIQVSLTLQVRARRCGSKMMVPVLRLMNVSEFSSLSYASTRAAIAPPAAVASV